MGEPINLLGIVTGFAGIVGAVVWLIAIGTGGVAHDIMLDHRDEQD